MADSNLRQRKTAASNQAAGVTTHKTKPKLRSNSNITFADVVRVLATVAAIGLGLSYYLTSGESFTYGYKPWFTNLKKVKQHLQGEIKLTAAELAKYDGTNPKLPIYMAINGTIFDVSSSPHMYGPGGGYSVFAGRDATRAFVTGCFQEDRTTDMRGAEEAFLPIEDPNEVIGSGERKTRAEREKRLAKKKVQAEIERWLSFYSASDKYVKVGQVVGAQEIHTGPPPTLCDHAQRGRPKRKAGGGMENMGSHPWEN